MNETRVNLKHLLEDIRDSYPLPLEEVIINELIANSLDSGASQISFFIDPGQQSFTIMDNGRGMRRPALREYHNIAASTKARGRGIGFAGIGSKLSLLIAGSVVTETKGGRGSRSATAWHLASDSRAPWKFAPFSGRILSPRGTAVTIELAHLDSPLLSADFTRQTIINHYLPLFIPQLHEAILRFIYKKEVEFFVNGQKIAISESSLDQSAKLFRAYVGGRRTRQPAGFGYIAIHEAHQPFQHFGLAVSTYGKIIKYGWEWLGLTLKTNANLYGIVEIPGLAEILTINKMDFLRDAASLKKYYRFRKAIQEAVLPILEMFGEKQGAGEKPRELKPIAREVERTLRDIVADFPELLPLLGIKKIKGGGGYGLSKNEPLVGVAEKSENLVPLEPAGKREEEEQKNGLERTQKEKKSELGELKKRVKKGPAIYIGFETGQEDSPLARMVEDRVLINTSHPSHHKALNAGFEDYHAIFCVAWVLSQFLQEEHSTHQFINNFLFSWGKDESKIQQALK